MPAAIDDAIASLDESDRLLLSGAIKLGLGAAGFAAISSATAPAAIVIGSVTATGLVAIVPTLLVTGVYVAFAPEKQRRELFATVRQVNEAVNDVHRPVEWVEEKLWELSGQTGPAPTLIDDEAPTTEEKNLIDSEYFLDEVKDLLREFSDQLLEHAPVPEHDRHERTLDPASSGDEAPSVDVNLP